MTLLQNMAMHKTLEPMKCSSAKELNVIAVVEAVEMFANVANWSFLARTMCDPSRAGAGPGDERIA